MTDKRRDFPLNDISESSLGKNDRLAAYSERVGRVYLIGAGPGDPGLLTIKARDVLGLCDCVVYDHLVNPDILKYAPRAERIYAGKHSGEPHLDQEAINELMITSARQGLIIARLKGGDPFVFGRGGEEAVALAEAGIPFEVIPGVSAGWAVPAYAGIPLTHRRYASTVAFITGHEDPAKGYTKINWEKLATGIDTLVFFMCGKTLPTIVAHLIKYGRSPSTPIAIICFGTYENQQTYTSTLETILETQLPIPSPALAVLGEVVKLRDQLNWFEFTGCTEPALIAST